MEIRKTTMLVSGLALPVRRREACRVPANASPVEPDASRDAIHRPQRPLGSVDLALEQGEASFTMRESRVHPYNERSEAFSYPINKALDAYRRQQASASDDKARLSQLLGVDYYV